MPQTGVRWIKEEGVGAALDETRAEADYWRSYSRRVEGELVRVVPHLRRLAEYDRGRIAELEERVEELEGREH